MTKGIALLVLWVMALVGVFIAVSTVGPIALIGLGVLPIFLGAVIYWGLAPENRWFTFIKEGTAKVVVRGDADKKTLIRFKGHTLTKTGSVAKGNPGRHMLGGLVFYSCFWPLDDIAIYRFEWTGVTQGGEVEFHPEKWLDYVLLKDDVYYTKVTGAEDKELLPLELELVLTMRVINPSKALFKVQNWLETVLNRIGPAVRDIVTEKAYKEWIMEKSVLGDKVYEKTEEIRKEFLERYGVDLRKIQVKDIIPPKEYLEATLKQYMAERQREAVVVEADAEAKRKERVAEGEARRIGIVYEKIQEFGDMGKVVRVLESLEKSTGEGGGKWIVPFNIADLFKGVLTSLHEVPPPEEIKPLEAIPPESFREEIEQKLSKKEG